MESIDKLIDKGKIEREYSSVNLFAVSLMVSSIIFSAYSVIGFITDDEPFLYKCPEQESSNVVEMKRLDNISTKEVDLMLRSFIKDYLYHRYPKNKDQVKDSYEYIVRHSTGTIKYDFEDRLIEDNVNKVISDIAGGKLISFYPENSLKIKISKTSDGVFKVQIDGRYVKEVGGGDSDAERIDVRLIMGIEKQSPSLAGAVNGLVVTEYELSYVPDAVNNERVVLD